MSSETPPTPTPPRFPERLLGRMLPGPVRAEVLADLRERYAIRVEADGSPRRWYWWQAFRAIVPAVRLRFGRGGVRSHEGPSDGRRRPFRGGLGDLRLGLRGLRRRPGFAVLTTTTLAVGIGAATAMFSVVDPLLLRPLPYPHSDRLVALWNRSPGSDVEKDWHAPAHFRAFRERLTSLEDLTLFGGGQALAGAEDAPAEFWDAVQTTSGLMPLFGVRAIRGRVLQPADDEAGAETVALLSYDTWTERFGADENIVGKTVRVGAANPTVIGVIDPRTRILPEALSTVGAVSDVDVFMNITLDPEFLSNTGSWNYNVLGRLRDGVGFRQLDAELDKLVASGFIDEFGIDDDRFAVYAVSLLDEIVGGLRPLALALLAGVGLVLLVSCGNVALLLLARGSARVQEMSVRRALGASRGRVARQLLAESVVIAATGGLFGIGFAWALVRGLRVLGPIHLPRLAEVGMDLRVVLFGLSASLLTAFVFGAPPALRATGTRSLASLRGASRGGSVRGSGFRGVFTPGSAIAQAQIAFSLTLIVSAALLTRSYSAVLDQDPGFDRESVLTLHMDLGPSGPARSDRWSYVSDLLARIETLPGVVSAGVTNTIPLGSEVAWGGAGLAGTVEPVTAEFRAATPGYFDAMGIPLLNGRGFEAADMSEDANVAIVDRALVERYWPDRDPIGRTVGFGTDSLLVIGVVGTVRQYRLDEESPRVFIYYPYGVVPLRDFYVAVRTTLPPARLAPALRSTILEVASTAALEKARPLSVLVSESLATRRAGAVLMVAFGLVATFLALMGTYGLVSFRVAAARREIGLRMALGAAPGQVIRSVARFGASLAVIGAAVGVPLAFGAARLLAGQLFGVTAGDPISFVLGAIILGAVSILAAALPARRAARVDPALVFRTE